MSLKLKYGLPLTQVGLAIALLAWDWRWERWMMRHLGMVSGTSRPFKLLLSINAPVALPRALVYRHLPGWSDTIVFVIAIAVFWYWVALNVLSWQNQRLPYTFSWPPLRLIANCTAIAVGVIWLVVCCNEIQYRSEPLFSLVDYIWYIIILGLPLAWALVLVAFFGYDCLRVFSGRKLARNSRHGRR